MNDLTSAQTRRLAKLERVISKGFKKFVAVGTALARIRDARLYRATDATFQDYCRRRWKMDKSYAYRLITAAEVSTALSPIGHISTEAQARELASVPPEIRRLAWDRAKTNGHDPTALELRQAIDELTAEDKIQAVREEEERRLKNQERPKGPPRALLSRIDELLTRLGKLYRRLPEVSEEADGLLEKLKRLAG